PNAAERTLRMALAMRERVGELIVSWRKMGYELELGVGIAQGYATIGAIGYEGRWDYGAIGTVTNLAARLCGEAKPGQILVSKRVVQIARPGRESRNLITVRLLLGFERADSQLQKSWPRVLGERLLQRSHLGCRLPIQLLLSRIRCHRLLVQAFVGIGFEEQIIGVGEVAAKCQSLLQLLDGFGIAAGGIQLDAQRQIGHLWQGVQVNGTAALRQSRVEPSGIGEQLRVPLIRRRRSSAVLDCPL